MLALIGVSIGLLGGAVMALWHDLVPVAAVIEDIEGEAEGELPDGAELVLGDTASTDKTPAGSPELASAAAAASGSAGPGTGSTAASAGARSVPTQSAQAPAREREEGTEPDGPERLARIFAAMKPADAAKVLERLSDAEVRSILKHVADRKAAAILGHFDAARAASLSRSVMVQGMVQQ
jgi:hypothetical protein